MRVSHQDAIRRARQLYLLIADAGEERCNAATLAETTGWSPKVVRRYLTLLRIAYGVELSYDAAAYSIRLGSVPAEVDALIRRLDRMDT